MSDKPEPVEAEEAEIAEETTDIAVTEPVTQDGMDAVIAVGEKMAAYTKAMDMITNAIIKRAYPGDFISHAKAGDPPEKRKANIGAAAAERIAMFLGIQERNWTPGVRSVHDDGKHYSWIYEADFGFKNRWIHAIGRASSKDKFFSWKPVADISDEDIRMAAFRGARKEGVRGLLGLRAIPIDKLKELGYNIDQVNYVNFEDKGKALRADAMAGSIYTGPPEKIIIVATIKATEGTSKSNGKPWRRLEIKDISGVNWLMWSGPGSKREAILQDSFQSKAEVKIHFETSRTDRGEQYTIIKVNGE